MDEASPLSALRWEQNSLLLAEMEKDYTWYNKLVQKFNIVYDYFEKSWGIDLDKLREVVLRRSKEVEKGVDTDNMLLKK